MESEIIKSDELYKIYKKCLTPNSRRLLSTKLGYASNATFVNSLKHSAFGVRTLKESRVIREFFSVHGGYEFLLEGLATEDSRPVPCKNLSNKKVTPIKQDSNLEPSEKVTIASLKKRLASVAVDAVILENIDDMKTLISVLNSTISTVEFLMCKKEMQQN